MDYLYNRTEDKYKKCEQNMTLTVILQCNFCGNTDTVYFKMIDAYMKDICITYCEKHETDAIDNLNLMKWLIWFIEFDNKVKEKGYKIERKDGSIESEWYIYFMRYSKSNNGLILLMYKKDMNHSMKYITLTDFIKHNPNEKLLINTSINPYFEIDSINYINQFYNNIFII